MSPEQARDQPVDKRTDIWAFGCVLYEMLTSRPAFGAATLSDTLVAILEGSPDWSALPSALPSTVHQLLHRCLDKNPTRRLHDAADARIELEDALVEKHPPSRRPAGRPVMPWLGLIAALTAAAIGSWIWLNRSRATSSAPTRQTTRFSIQFPPDAPIIGSVGIGSQIALSPDGRTLVYAARAVAGSNHLYVRRFDQIETRLLPGTKARSIPSSPRTDTGSVSLPGGS
jgi:serine/threonine-protein kinase